MLLKTHLLKTTNALIPLNQQPKNEPKMNLRTLKKPKNEYKINKYSLVNLVLYISLSTIINSPKVLCGRFVPHCNPFTHCLAKRTLIMHKAQDIECLHSRRWQESHVLFKVLKTCVLLLVVIKRTYIFANETHKAVVCDVIILSEFQAKIQF